MLTLLSGPILRLHITFVSRPHGGTIQHVVLLTYRVRILCIALKPFKRERNELANEYKHNLFYVMRDPPHGPADCLG